MTTSRTGIIERYGPDGKRIENVRITVTMTGDFVHLSLDNVKRLQNYVMTVDAFKELAKVVGEQ